MALRKSSKVENPHVCLSSWVAKNFPLASYVHIAPLLDGFSSFVLILENMFLAQYTFVWFHLIESTWSAFRMLYHRLCWCTRIFDAWCIITSAIYGERYMVDNLRWILAFHRYFLLIRTLRDLHDQVIFVLQQTIHARYANNGNIVYIFPSLNFFNEVPLGTWALIQFLRYWANWME